MFELLIIVPNLIAGFLLMRNNAFWANAVYCIGYLPFIYRNFIQDDMTQTIYFSILWVMSIIGVICVTMNHKEKPVPETEFEEAIVELCRDIGDMLIEKNRLYGDSYRNLRVDAQKELKNPRIPFWLHLKEKLSRYMENKPDDTEDIIRDSAGYCILEAVCARLDDAKQI